LCYTLFHFAAVLLVSALIRVPWETMTPVAALLIVIGFAGVAYEIAVARHMRRQTVYEPDLEDWAYHLLLPSAAYALLVGSGFAAATSLAREAFFGVAGGTLLLLFVGIHNAWDSVVYHVFIKQDADRDRR
jgi:hypothetical protein